MARTASWLERSHTPMGFAPVMNFYRYLRCILFVATGLVLTQTSSNAGVTWSGPTPSGPLQRGGFVTYTYTVTSDANKPAGKLWTFTTNPTTTTEFTATFNPNNASTSKTSTLTVKVNNPTASSYVFTACVDNDCSDSPSQSISGTVPEIGPAGLISALTALGGVVFIVRERRRPLSHA